MQDNRWLYFIVGGLAVVALIFFAFFHDRDAPTTAGGPGIQTEAPDTTVVSPRIEAPTIERPAAEAPASETPGAAAGEGARDSTSVTIERQRD